jgi:hypothetical protein
MGCRSVALALAIIALSCAGHGDAGAQSILKTEHRGIELAAMPLREQQNDILLLAPKTGIHNLRMALDRLYATSPFSVRHLETLKENGRVTIVYDAAFPKRQLSKVTIAAFFPDFFQKETGRLKQFLVVVGRFGVKWETNKLAAVIAHELVGHGLQHFRGHRDKDRKIDLECEALIYEMRAQQDLGIRPDTNGNIRFRKHVRGNWCADFGRYMTAHGLNVDKAWGYGRPNVPTLLRHFDDYRRHLRRIGVSAKAVAAAKSQRATDFANFKAEAERTKSAKKMLIVGQRYLKGVGVKLDIRMGSQWVAKSARLGHPPAQFIMGVLNATGHGMRKDPVEAYAWLSAAVAKGFNKAGKSLAKLEKQLSPAQKAEGRQRAEER